jgi:hypothetical protein
VSNSEAALRAALDLGGLIYDRSKCGQRGGPVWRFGQRFFRPSDVNELIASGFAVRIGNQVVKA